MGTGADREAAEEADVALTNSFPVFMFGSGSRRDAANVAVLCYMSTQSSIRFFSERTLSAARRIDCSLEMRSS